MVCPICKKVGIDLSEKKCPQCGSDLSALYDIHLLKSKKTQRYYLKILLPIFILTTLLLMTLLIQYAGIIKDNKMLQAQIVNLKDSIDKNTVINDSIKIHSKLESSNITREIKYIVKNNDSLWKLSKIFYDDGSKYYKINNYNNLSSDLLIVGQILKIPLE